MTRSTGRLVTGGLIVALGLVLLVGTTGVFPTATLWDWFPALFVVIGAWALVRSGFRNLTGPVLVIAIAGAFLLRNLGILPEGTIGTYWPVFIILFGLLVIFGRHRRHVQHGDVLSNGELTEFAVFGSSRSAVASKTFAGGDVVSIFGENDIDLRDAAVENPPAVLDTMTIFGSTEVRVPSEWTVQVDALGIFGATDDKRRTVGGEGEPDLVITGLVIFGALELHD